MSKLFCLNPFSIDKNEKQRMKTTKRLLLCPMYTSLVVVVSMFTLVLMALSIYILSIFGEKVFRLGEQEKMTWCEKATATFFIELVSVLFSFVYLCCSWIPIFNEKSTGGIFVSNANWIEIMAPPVSVTIGFICFHCSIYLRNVWLAVLSVILPSAIMVMICLIEIVFCVFNAVYTNLREKENSKLKLE